MNLANKLSTHVLGMKFMRRTKTQVDKERVEKKHREHFQPAPFAVTEDIERDANTLEKTTGHVEEIPSYSQCEKWIFGRQSFGGFNPEVELNVQKGVWKNHYVGEPPGTNEEEEPIKREADNEVDVPDEEMAATYGSIIGTLAKHFKKKRDRNDAPNPNGNNNKNKEILNRKEKPNFQHKQKFQQGKADGQAGNSRNQNQQHGQHGNNRRGQKRGHQGQGQDHQDRDNRRDNQNQQRQNQSNKKYFGNKNQKGNGPEYGTPPKKKRFMKPSDD